MQLKQLISLYILQKNHHQSPEDIFARASYEMAYQPVWQKIKAMDMMLMKN